MDIVSLSTTLVTNAAGEGHLHPVGLLLTPSTNFAINDFDHTPFRVIQGRMTIDGIVTKPVNPEEIVPVIRKIANAVGAVTSKVSVSLRASVVPAGKDRYRIIGMKCSLNDYATLEEAGSVYRKKLEKNVIALAEWPVPQRRIYP